MSENIFWDKKITRARVKKILCDEANPRFVELAALLLSRTNNPKGLFTDYLDKVIFCRNWRKIKKRMRQNKWTDNRIIFWDEVYRVVLQDLDKNQLHMQKTKLMPVHFDIEQIGSIVRKARRKKGLTQKQLAQNTGLSQQTISFAEKGYQNFSFKTLIKIINALDLKISIESKNRLPVSTKESYTSSYYDLSL